MKLFSAMESLRMSLRSIASNKIRSFLTGLGVMIGVAAVIALVALGNGAQVSVQQSLESLGSNLLIVYSGEPRGASLVRRNTTNIKPTISQEDVEAMLALGPGLVNLIAPESTATAQVKFENRNAVATVSGTTEAYSAIRNFYAIHGTFLTAADVETRRSVAVIGAGIYRDLFPEGGDPVGRKIRIDGISFTVVGIMEEKGSSAQDTSIFIPITAFQRYVSGDSEYATVNVQAA
ncbi:MAG TPA: ABC transporter permease, partial [Spirochaetia bacterium]|nr:ABC transporter permease [Spirochaetia bacterium]